MRRLERWLLSLAR